MAGLWTATPGTLQERRTVGSRRRRAAGLLRQADALLLLTAVREAVEGPRTSSG